MENEEVRDIKYFLRALVDDVIAPIFIIDEEKRVKSYNKALLNLFQIEEKEIINKKPGELFGCTLLKDCEECTTTDRCMECELNKLASISIEQNLPVENKVIRKEFRISNDVITKDIRISIKPISHKNKRFFVVILDDITEAITLQDKLQSQNEKMKRDLLVAKGIQNGLLPETGAIGHLKLDYLYRPCEALGGDFIDFYRIDNRHIGIIMADVSGHGLASSMFTVFLYSLIDRTMKSPAVLLKKVFVEFSKFKVSSETYITMFSAVFNTKTNVLTVANAGFSNPPSIIRERGIESLHVSGIPISNWVEDTEYDEVSTKLKKGERLVMFSDGITETMNSNGHAVGDDFILNILSDKSIKGEEVVRKALYEARIESSTKIKDDITIAVIDYI
ncbi:MAG: SpoIIE family protein phosphatase [Clostridia bacterium]|nr:SpoIIE family protein phosphatase [Clostridia bacterium]